MKKELLVATALVSSMGLVANSASAASATFSGHTRVGATGSDLDSGATDTYGATQLGTFTVSLSETTDAGMKISTGFDLTNESDGATDPSGLTLTFTDGSKLDLIEAGNAATSKLASVPSASGEQGVAAGSLNAAPGALSYADTSDAVGFEWHSASDAFGVAGLTAGLSASLNDDASATTTTNSTQNSYSVGVSYVTDLGDSSVTIGGGLYSAEGTSSSATKDAASAAALSISAVTGDLTVGVGFASGDFIRNGGSDRDAMDVDGADYMTAGVKYVSGDPTFALGVSQGEGTDNTVGQITDTTTDKKESMGASVDYAVASGVTATLGWSDAESENEGSIQTSNSGSSWYIGATVSF